MQDSRPRNGCVTVLAPLFPLPVRRGRARVGAVSRRQKDRPPPQPSPGVPGEGEMLPGAMRYAGHLPVLFNLLSCPAYNDRSPLGTGLYEVSMLHPSTASFVTPLALGMPQGFEWLLIMGIGLLLFGKR